MGTTHHGARDPVPFSAPAPLPFVLSAAGAAALRGRARRLAAHLRDDDGLRLEDVAYTLASTDAGLAHRAVVFGDDADGLQSGLRGLAEGVRVAHVVAGTADSGVDLARGPVFVFSGHGCQWSGMAVELMEQSPVFAAHLRACAEALAVHVDYDIEGVLRGDAGQPPLEGVDVVQPVLFAIMVSLAALWRAVGVEPAAVVGHSQGEIAAAHVAGALSLEDAARVVALRSRALRALSGRGGLVSVSLSPEEVARRLDRFADRLVVGAVNAPGSVALSGDLEALDEVLSWCEAEGVRARRVRIDYAAHSPQVEEIRTPLLEALGPVAPRTGRTPLFSTVTGDLFDTARMDAAYWYEGERQPVQLDAVVRRLLDHGHRAFVEISPHPVLTPGIQESIEAALADPGEAVVVATLRREQGGRRRFLTSLAELYARGADVAWARPLHGHSAELVNLPDPADVAAVGDADAPEPTIADRVRASSAVGRQRLVLDLVVAEVAAVLGLTSGAAVDATRAFKEAGVDSAAALEVRNRLVQATGLPLPTTLLFDHANPRALAARLVGEMTGEREDHALPSAVMRAGEPIAIVGIGCRYPGQVRSAEDLWELVASRGDAIGDFPTDRGWDLERLFDAAERSGSTYVRQGGFIYDAAEFDAEHFSISPREALSMDPHQRLLLECAWEALEDAGIDPLGLAGSLTGVFAGIYGLDYGPRMHEGEARTAGYGLTGTLPAVVSGRVAYVLGLEGPAVSVDTACSSSLVALHLACQALRQGECTLALAGGATIMSSPGIFVDFARQRGLSPDGRCRAYGAGANGTGFADGVGILALEPLSVAQARGHRVLALIRGSAINQDGASNGLTAPSGRSQERVIRQALASAGLGVDDVDAVEGHGTGTELGDPIEAGALMATYGCRQEGTVWLGSLKSNIGHTQAAAGVGGVIKMVMALRHGVLPPTLHADEPSPHVDWEAGRLRPLAAPVEWPRQSSPRRASVSSFGISGTNAHLVLEEAPVSEAPRAVALDGEDTPSAAPPLVLPFIVSGSNEAALAAQAGRLREHIAAHPDLDPTALASSLALGRARLPYRAIALAPGLEELTQQLGACEHGEDVDGLRRGVARLEPRVGFVFPGQGGQWPGMALELVEQWPAFAEHMEASAAAIASHVDFDLMGVLRGDDGQPTLDEIEVVQPALFAIMVSLAGLWRSFGVEPAAVVGHSQGEIAAAHIAGGLSLEDAARIVCVRSRLLARIEGGGGMMAVALPAHEFEDRARAWDGRVTLAAVNGPASLVVSGDPEALDELERSLEADGVWRRRIGSTVAGHSPHVEVAREEMLSALADIEPRASELPVFSTVSGQQATTESMDAEHWYRNLRQTVQFEPAVRALAGAGIDVLIEIGPHPVLAASALGILESERDRGAVAALGTLHRDEGGLRRFVAALAEAHVRGVSVDWEPLFGGTERVELPRYAFQRSRYWLAPGGGSQDAGALGQARAEHPLLGAMVHVAGGEGLLFTGRLSLESQPWLADHAAVGTVLLPGTAFLELALYAAAQTDTPVIEELTLAAPLTLAADGVVALQVTVSGADEEGRRRVVVYSRPDGGAVEWTEHASGTLSADDREPPRAAPWPVGGDEVDPEDAYALLAEGGYEYGPAFQGLRRLVRTGDTAYAEIGLAQDQESRASEFGIHPALADAALHAAMLAGLDAGDDGPPTPEIPFSFAGVHLSRRGSAALRVEVTGGQRTWRIVATDPEGAPVFSIDALQTRPLDASRLAAQRGGHDALFAVEWTVLPAAPEPESRALAVVGPRLPIEADGDQAIPHYENLAALGDAIAAGADAPDCVLVGVEADAGPLPEAAHIVTARALELLREWLAAEPLADARLVLVTRRALAAAAGESPDLRQAPLPGLLRSAHSEHPDRFALIDTDDGELTDVVLLAALASAEPEIAVRAGALLVPRLQRFRGDDVLQPPDGEAQWSVAVQTPGTLESLQVVRHRRAGDALGPGEVSIAVHAAGINFRDVGVTLGLLDGGADMQIGFEGAGVVLEVGADVTDLAPGDGVMGLIPHGFGPWAVADRRHLARLPAGWSYTQAASVPLVFLTAYHGLVDLAGLKGGDAVLVHGAAGGVGMAAMQIARHLGAEVFGTAHPRKWDTLRALGLDDDHIASSRTADFEDAFLRTTDGRGIDVVLDSLAGPLVDASLRLLPRGGRFIEMGKTDIREPETVAREHPGVAYQAFDLRETPPERIGEMLAEIIGLFEQGVFEHLPIATWDLRCASAAFRVLRDSSHTGKLVFCVPQPAPAHGTVLVTGGTGGLGALVARHLVEQGARRLLLVSRRGADASGAGDLTAELEELGCQVEIAACDASDRAALERLLDAIPAEHPLTAVVHAAGVLDDGVVTALDTERLRRVLTPKLDAALHLHELTRGLELSEFILFSSAAAAVGSPGQANYAAANAFLDALAAARRAEGLPALSLAFGLWQRVTGMSEHLATDDGLRAGPMDMLPLPDELGLQLIDRARQTDRPLLVPMLLDLAKLRARARSGVLPSIFTGLVRTPSRSGGAGTSFARMLADAPESERERIAVGVVRTHAAAVLGHASPDAIVEDRAFKEAGFDSLSAVELRNRIAAATGLTLPATLVFDYPTPLAVSRLLLERAEDRTAEVTVAPASRPTDEPIAIVGLGCRYPGGVGSADDLWNLVVSGGDGIGEFPSDRGWDIERLFDPERSRAGTSYVRHGGFVNDATRFDAEHFSISPREALAMDPQQRLLLECAWEVLEHAGIDPLSLRGSATGVFVGAYASDYGVGVEPPEEVLGLRLTGSVTSVISGRVAYVLGLEGPAVTIDTACSSSLVSLHLACQALRAGECDLALAGGVCVLATPTAFVEFSRQGGLSPDGRCRAFSADADGTGFSEGAGLIALMPLSVAQERGQEVLAVIRGSAINQDGASNGLSAPSGPSQERVIRQALANAGLGPDDVDVVEAHGTGTELGDPIEAGALIATYGRRANGPLWLGSLKSNIGHTQTAAGVAGVIKMVMAMRHELLAPTLYAAQASPHVDWDVGAVRLLAEPVRWPRGNRPRRAGVSSFGISGTNAHLLLEEPPPQPALDTAQEPESRPAVLPFLVSGSSAAALQAQAGRLRELVESGAELEPSAVAGALARDRAQLLHRAVAVAPGLEGLAQQLRALEQGEAADGVVRGVARREGRVGFVFPGQGGQWAGMAVELLEQSPVFAERMQTCAAALAPHIEFDLLGVVRGEPGQPTLNPIEVVQPVLFAIMVSLVELWRSFGVTPAAVVGHSQGEIVAAHVAGVLSLQDAARIVSVRSRCLSQIEGGGGMMAVALSAQAFAERATAWSGRITVAAVNGPASLIVSGDPDALDELELALEADHVWSRRIASTVAGHSPHVEVAREELLSALASIAPRRGEIPLYSTVSGALVATETMDAEHWYRNLRQTVQFAPAVQAMGQDGVRTLIEISPHPVLTAAVADTMEAAGVDPQSVQVIGSIRRDEGGLERFTGALAEAHVAGVDVDWTGLVGSLPRPRVALPTYAFQRRRYWLAARRGEDSQALGLTMAEHPLLGAKLRLGSGDGCVWTGRLSLADHTWLADHAVMGKVMVPATMFLELALHAAEEMDAPVVEELTMSEPLVLQAGSAVALQVSVSSTDEEGRHGLAIYSQPETDGDWTQHAAGTIAGERGGRAAVPAPLAWPVGGDEREPAIAYAKLAEAGYDLGPAFQGLERAVREGDAVYAEAVLGEDVAGAHGFELHPALLEAALHALPLADADEVDAALAEMPFAFVGVRLDLAGAASLQVRLTPAERGWSVVATDADGAPVLSIDAVRTRAVDAARPAAAPDVRNALYSIEWTTVPEVPGRPGDTGVAVLGAGPPIARSVRHDDLGALVAAVVAGAPPPDQALVVVASPAGDDLLEDIHALSERVLALLQAWLAVDGLTGSRLVVVTQRAVAATDGERPDVLQAPLAGLLRAASSEHPGRFAVIDTDGHERSTAALAVALASGEPELALRRGTVLAPRVRRFVPDAVELAKPALGPGPGTILITGGTTGLGATFARRLAERHGVGHLLLVSRRGTAAPGVDRLVAELHAAGCAVEVAACDVTDRAALQRLIAVIPADRPLTAVVHAAAALDDGVLTALDGERLRRVMAPKVDAALHLHELTRDLPLSEFILFSSAAACLGSPGQGNYAAANAFLDALAAARQADGLPGLALAFGFWERVTELTEHLTTSDGRRSGPLDLLPMSDELGLALIDTARTAGRPMLAPMRFDLAALAARARAGILPPIMSDLVRVRPRRPAAATGGGVAAGNGAGAVNQAHSPEAIRNEIAASLGYTSPEAVDPQLSFLELGFDSLVSLELRKRLQVVTGVVLPATVMFDHPTPAALIEHLQGLLGGPMSDAVPVANGSRHGNGSAANRTLTAMFRRAVQLRRVSDAVAIAEAAARLRPRFGVSHSEGEAPAVIPLAAGESDPVVFCIPSLIASSGPHEYARLAQGFAGRREVVAVPVPGFAADELLPSMLDAVAGAQAAAIKRHADGRPVALVGFSTGGLLAYALAAECAREGLVPAAVVVIDSYTMDTMWPIAGPVFERMLEGDGEHPAVDDHRLTAMGAYLGLLSAWTPEPPVAPTLLVKAADPEPGVVRVGDWSASWPLRHAAIDLPGTHLTILSDHAQTTARAIDDWLTRQPSGPGGPGRRRPRMAAIRALRDAHR